MSTWLLVQGGEGNDDFGVVEMDEEYTPKEVYDIMIKEKVQFKDFLEEDGSKCFTAEIIEFGDVDPDFADFIKDELCNYDLLKGKDLFFISE